MYSRTSAIFTSDTVEPRWGAISTRPSSASRAKASLTGKRDTSNWAQIAVLSSMAPGGKARVTMAWRSAWVTSAVTLPRVSVGGRVKKE